MEFDVAELCALSRPVPKEINFEWKYAFHIDSTLHYIPMVRYPHNLKLRWHLIFIFGYTSLLNVNHLKSLINHLCACAFKQMLAGIAATEKDLENTINLQI